MKFTPKSAKRIKKVNNGIKISKIYPKISQKWHYNPFLLPFFFWGGLRPPTSPIRAGIYSLFFKHIAIFCQ